MTVFQYKEKLILANSNTQNCVPLKITIWICKNPPTSFTLTTYICLHVANNAKKFKNDLITQMSALVTKAVNMMFDLQNLKVSGK